MASIPLVLESGLSKVKLPIFSDDFAAFISPKLILGFGGVSPLLVVIAFSMSLAS